LARPPGLFSTHLWRCPPSCPFQVNTFIGSVASGRELFAQRSLHCPL
jgi:hypothetical protein